MEILYGAGRAGMHIEEIQSLLGKRHTVTPFYLPLHHIANPDLAPETKALVVFVDSMITEKVLDCFPKLKFIATQSTGTDHINLEACKKRGIIVSHVPGYGGTSVGELTILLLLGIARNLKHSLENDRKGRLVRDGESGFELKGKTLAIIGTGAIGATVARLAKAFGMKIIFYDLHPDKSLARSVRGRYAKDIDEIWEKADVVSFHVPLTSGTHHMVSYEEIEKMKPGVTIINTARGGIINSLALLHGLNNGKIKGVGLDVLEFEQFMTKRRHKNKEIDSYIKASRKLLHHPKVLHSMHLGAHTREAQQRIQEVTITNLKHFITKNKKPVNVVTS